MATSNSASTDVRSDIIAVGQRIMATKGYSGVGINEILTTASVPKGSFYHYFASKDAFGEAMLVAYFEQYLAAMDNTLGGSDAPGAQRLLAYFNDWRSTQSLQECQGKCLAVKLGAEVADLSDTMRAAMKLGTDGIVSRLAQAIQAARDDQSLPAGAPPAELAESLYQLWMGASVLAKVARNARPFDAAMASTLRLLGLQG
ncbi:TetR/AcrR family transcriptional regulator [Ideonella margarita]|uniref:TetR/AcrR family transcriptional regulator n=1 Tax=Ideonella margarita TaxID=2984191 RepID=A0ABU9C8H5_9BURK